MKIDFVSHVSCPWYVIGLKALEDAIARLGGQVKTEIDFQPLELKPRMPSEGQDNNEHLAEKYRATPVARGGGFIGDAARAAFAKLARLLRIGREVQVSDRQLPEPESTPTPLDCLRAP